MANRTLHLLYRSLSRIASPLNMNYPLSPRFFSYLFLLPLLGIVACGDASNNERYNHTCSNGTPTTEKTSVQDAQKCIACDTNYVLTNAACASDIDNDGIADSEDDDDDDDGKLDNEDDCSTGLEKHWKSDPMTTDRDDDGCRDGTTEDPDGDEDKYPDDSDNCPDVANPDQSNRDRATGDTQGDACDDDLDGDGKDNEDDACDGPNSQLNWISLSTGDEITDRDDDGCKDGSSEDPDSDNDSYPDDNDNCPNDQNSGQENRDNDRHGDACDNDVDGDGIANSEDDCNEPDSELGPFADNDSDGCRDDSEEDLDDDNDGVNDLDADGSPLDNCPTVANPDQENRDSDTIIMRTIGNHGGDACDTDDDNDGVPDIRDNCRLIANGEAQRDTDGVGNQLNRDGDTYGDACDPDDDNDLVLDVDDNCRLTANGEAQRDTDGVGNQLNRDGDTYGDACDDDLDGDGVDNLSDTCDDDSHAIGPFTASNGPEADTDGDGCRNDEDDDDDNDTVLDTEDIDADNDGLIEIDNLDMLRNVQYDLEGHSYDTDATDTPGAAYATCDPPTPTNKGSVCGAPIAGTEAIANCVTARDHDGDSDTPAIYLCGYELTQSLDFADDDSYATGSMNKSAWCPDPVNNCNSSTNSDAGFLGIGTSDGADTVTSGGFAAIFEGNGHTIKNLYMRNSANTNHYNIGLFRRTESSAKIRNLGLIDVNIHGGSMLVVDYAGSLVAKNHGAISASYATRCDVNGDRGEDILGGLVGVNEGAIENSHATRVAVNGGGNGDTLGGLVGSSLSTIRDSYATGNVEGGDVSSGNKVGGLAGINEGTEGTIENSHANVDVTGGTGSDNAVGGLVGSNGSTGTGTIVASYATGNVKGGDRASNKAGGLVGNNGRTGTIVASYATGNAYGGDIDNNEVGGLVGSNGSTGTGTVVASYATGNAYGGSGNYGNVGGLVGRNEGAITASYATGNAYGGGGNEDEAGGLVGNNGSGSITASYATGNAYGGSGNNDLVGGLVGGGVGSIIASYATGNVYGGDGIGDTVGSLLAGEVGGGFGTTLVESYGFGAATGGALQTGGEGDAKPAGVTTASDISQRPHDDWNVAKPATTPAIYTKDAWKFGSHLPRLKFGDYEETGNECDTLFPTRGPGPNPTPIVCGTTELPGQEDSDGDEKLDVVDGCPRSATNWKSNAASDGDGDGCRDDTEDVDDDNDGLIEISNLDMLVNINNNLSGTSYDDEPNDDNDAFAACGSHSTTDNNKGSTCGAPKILPTACEGRTTSTHLCGYELIGSLDFAEADCASSVNYASASTNCTNNTWRPKNASNTVLADTITATATATTAGFPGIGTASDGFSAIFEGNGHTIKNLYMRNIETNVQNVGLFRRTEGGVNDKGIIRNFGLIDAHIYGSNTASEAIGSMVGVNNGIVVASYARATSTAKAIAHGVDGDSDRVGALVGVNGGTIALSYSQSTANGGSGDDGSVGGLVGRNLSSIRYSYATGNVEGSGGSNDSVGGLVGVNGVNIIQDSYATGDATGENVGALTGDNDSSSIIQKSYGFGTSTGGTPNRIGQPPSTCGMTRCTPTTMTRSAAGGWTLPIWKFSTGSIPKLKYASITSVYTCSNDQFLPYGDSITCNTTEIPN